ncbi:hypothetical protein KAX03_01520 [Candidatus Bathyarchaeota archaeon]|nr:hypothetical protein [Candidatus Bathyarchaeota archaeon]
MVKDRVKKMANSDEEFLTEEEKLRLNIIRSMLEDSPKLKKLLKKELNDEEQNIKRITERLGS